MDTQPLSTERAPADDRSSRVRRDAIARAIEYGVDVTLLIENLRYSPVERLRRGERVLKSMMAFKQAIDRARQLQKDDK